jgi:DNA modification methylase
MDSESLFRRYQELQQYVGWTEEDAQRIIAVAPLLESCLSALDRLLDGAVIHLVNTDPPYNVKVEPRSNNAIAAGLSSFEGTKHHQRMDVVRYPQKAKPTGKKLRAKDRPLANDFVSDQEFDRLLHAWFGNLARVLLPGHGFFV